MYLAVNRVHALVPGLTFSSAAEPDRRERVVRQLVQVYLACRDPLAVGVADPLPVQRVQQETLDRLAVVEPIARCPLDLALRRPLTRGHQDVALQGLQPQDV